jgi:uncharacterized protein (DUF924 family)
MILMHTYEDILNYWFDGLDDQQKIQKSSPIVRRWFIKSRQTDEEIRRCFEEDLIMAREGRYLHWEDTICGRLALILLFDQFSRNIYRDTPRMYATDPLALSLSLRCMEGDSGDSFPLVYRIFLHMPLMHAEDLALQEKSVSCFSRLVKTAQTRSPQNAEYFAGHLRYAIRHRDIIARFGRFPHRNVVLNRPSTSREDVFLKGPGAAF